MRPVVVIESSAELGGAELSLLPVIRRLAAQRPVVSLLPASGPLEAALAESGASIGPGLRLPPVLEAASGSYGLRSTPRILAAAAAQQVRAVAALARLGPAVVYCNGFRAQVAATAPARVAAAPVAWHVRDFARPGALGAVWGRLSRHAALVMANSGATASQPALEGLDVRVEPPGVDRERFRPRSAEPGGAPTIGMAAHLTPWKGHIEFLDLVAALRESDPSVRARIAGAPIYRTAGHDEFARRVDAEIGRRGLAEACTVEAVDHADMPSWLAGLHLLVHCPTRPEPFGRALAEALAVGVPVVSSSAGGAPEVLGDSGVLVAPGDPGALRAAVADLLGDAGARARLSASGPARVAERFDEARRADSVAQAILSLGRGA